MKKINISISGALGKMGKILIKKISENKSLKLVSATDLERGSKKIIKRIRIKIIRLRRKTLFQIVLASIQLLESWVIGFSFHTYALKTIGLGSATLTGLLD